MFGAITALLVSFVALSTLWTEPRFEGRPEKTARPSWIQSILTSRALEWTIRIVMLLFFLVVAMASARRVSVGDTIGPIVVFDWFWVGLAIAHALFGNLWATMSPFDTIGRLAGFGDESARPYPVRWGRWPAAILLFGFVWIELVQPFDTWLGSLGFLIVAYTLIQIAGMQRYGRKVWLENGEAFGVYLGLIAGIAPFSRDREGRVVTRPFLAGLARVEPRPGLLAVIMVALGSTTFDGFSRTSLWFSLTSSVPGPGSLAHTVVFTAGLLGVIMLVTLAYALAMRVAARVVDAQWHPLAVRFAHSLVPIMLAYVVAHYFSFLVLEGQLGLIRLSDPFGLGWDLFGTGDWAINLALVSPTTIWYVQVAAIVIGHVAGVILAHDRAIAMFDREDAIRTQYALLAVMVAFTATGLLILSG